MSRTELHKDHTQKLYDLTIHTLDTDHHGTPDRYVMAYILCYIFGFDYATMKQGRSSNDFIRRVAFRVADMDIRELWIRDMRKSNPDWEYWWEKRYLLQRMEN